MTNGTVEYYTVQYCESKAAVAAREADELRRKDVKPWYTRDEWAQKIRRCQLECLIWMACVDELRARGVAVERVQVAGEAVAA